jgi:putative ABC transport system permease protein
MTVPPVRRWLRLAQRLLGARLFTDAFEPAYHDLLGAAVRDAPGESGRAGFRLHVRTALLLAQCLLLRRHVDPASPRSGATAMLRQDVAWAVRSLRGRPGFTFSAVLTLALGMGAATTVFSLVDGVLLKPLPYRDAGQLVVVDAVSAAGYGISLSVPNYFGWQERNRSFTSFTAAAGGTARLVRDGTAELLQRQMVIGDFFGTLGLDPLIGRVFGPHETHAGAESLVVLGHAFWQRAFGGDASVIGSSITLGARAWTITGVLRPGEGYPSANVDLYVPMGALAASLPWDDPESSFGARAVARLRPGVDLAAAQVDMRRVTDEIEAEFGRDFVTALVHPFSDLFNASLRTPALVLGGAVFFVLLIAAANVANLLLVRGEDRRREMAVRAALGASRAALVRQLLVESMILSVAGALAGIAFTALALRFLPQLAGSLLPSILVPRIAIDLRVVGAAAGIAALTGLGFGALPALGASRSAPGSELREGGRGTGDVRARRARSFLVAAEVGLALALLVCAGLMIESLSRLRSSDSGFSAAGVASARVHAGPFETREQWLQFYGSLRERLEAQPDVGNAAVTLLVPLADRSWEQSIIPEGAPVLPNAGESVLFNTVSPEYFATLGIQFVRGRGFGPGDTNASPPVAVIDETMAEKFWPGDDPIGKRVAFELVPGSTMDSPVPVYRTVVGVVPNLRHYDLRTPSRIQVYVPFAQTLEAWGMGMHVLARGGDAAAIARRIPAIVREQDPLVPLSEVRPLEVYRADSIARERMLGVLLAAFGVTALLLACVGVAGVIGVAVTRQRREIGVRLAMGARPGQVVRMFVGQSLRMAGAGAFVGLFVAAALSRALASLLYGVRPFDLRTYGLAAAVLLLTAMLAAFIPARRAARVDPSSSLRAEV